jgi:hypothetical protein
LQQPVSGHGQLAILDGPNPLIEQALDFRAIHRLDYTIIAGQA